MSEREAALEAVLAAALSLVEQGLGSDTGYFQSPGFPATERLRSAIRGCGVEIVYQRGTAFESRTSNFR